MMDDRGGSLFGSEGAIVAVSHDGAELRLIAAALDSPARRVVALAAEGLVAGFAATTAVACVLVDAAAEARVGLARRLRADPVTDAPVVLLVDGDEKEGRLAAYRAGADDYLVRPISAGLLGACVEAAVSRRRALAGRGDEPGVLASLARAAEVHDPYTGGHLERLMRFSGRVANELGLGRLEVEGLRIGGLLHDVGKVAVASEIIRKPGPLTGHELAEMRLHPQHGEGIVKGLRLGQVVAPIVRHHHEHFDGAGYPDGVAGDEIPIGARVVAVVDAYDAMVTDRPYRPALGQVEARLRLARSAGAQFDPEVVRAFLLLPL